MKSLITTAVDLCLLRMGPQDIPASQTLLLVSFVLNFIVGVLMVIGFQADLTRAFLETLFQIVLMLGALYLALHITKRLSRFNQTATALMLSGLLLGLMVLTFGDLESTQSVDRVWSVDFSADVLEHCSAGPYTETYF